MNKKTWCIIVVAIVAIFLSGCGQLGNNDEPTKTTNYRVGTKGLTIDVLNAPDRIYEGDQLQMIIEVANDGAYPQPDGKGGFEGAFSAYLWFGGYDPSSSFFDSLTAIIQVKFIIICCTTSCFTMSLYLFISNRTISHCLSNSSSISCH